MTSSDAEFEKLISDAGEWAAQDPDPVTAAALSELAGLASNGVAAARQQLEDSFSGTLQFGTAGLRAALGPGPNRMNRVVVRRAAAGLAAFLKDAVEAAARERGRAPSSAMTLGTTRTSSHGSPQPSSRPRESRPS